MGRNGVDEMKPSLDSLPAIAGGQPAREKPTPQAIPLDEEGRRDAQMLIEGGELSAWRGGMFCRRLERAFALWHDRPAAIAVNSGTSALHCAYVAAGLKAGDEVIIPAAGYVSAASAVVQEGGVPVICDIDPESLALDPSLLEACITSRTKLIVAVHLWGIPADMMRITEIARFHGIGVIEDCAQAHGALLNGQLVGTFGVAATYSFAPGKLISTGQGGMVICVAEESGEIARSVANKGKGVGWHDYLRHGCSYVMPEFEAVAGLSGLRQLPDSIRKRNRAVEIYREVLTETDLRLPLISESRESSFFKMPIRLPHKNRLKLDAFIEALNRDNIGARSTHPPMHKIPWLAQLIECHGSKGQSKPSVAERELPLVVELETGPYSNEDDMWLSALAVLRCYRYINA
jgi:perosamine synthetase